MKEHTKNFVLTAVICAVFCIGGLECKGQSVLEPDETYCFAEKDSTRLCFDLYYPSDGSEMQVNGVNKPTIIYVFGGGFKGGRRDTQSVKPWFKMLADEGFTIVAIDYRLGLKDVKKMGIAQAGLLYDSIQMAVEDLFSATSFILDYSEHLDINPDALVVAGSSAGAITALQADWEICNGTKLASMLPEGFRYAGVMSFSGAVYSKMGKVRYRKHEPAPTLMLHGTADKIVPYKQIRLFNQAFQGTGKISKEFISKDYDYNIYRFEGNGHEIAGAMVSTFPEQLRWLETNVMKKSKRTVDALVNDPSITKWNIKDAKSIYSEDVNLD